MLNIQKNTLIKSASYFAVGTSILIMAAKLYAWIMTDSQAILASLVDSMLDISSSVINLLAIKIALQPPDDNHRFGHEKFQDLAIFSQSIFFFTSSIFTMSSSIKAIIKNEAMVNPEIGLKVMIFTIFIVLVLVMYQSYVIRKTSAELIAVDKLHYFSDLLTNVSVVVSIYLSSYYTYIDQICGIFISIYVMYASMGLFRKAIKHLSDEEFAEEERSVIIDIIAEHPMVKGVHDLKTRRAGAKHFIQFHIEMDPDIQLLLAHQITEEIMANLKHKFGEVEVTIHQDPAGVCEEVQYRDKIRNK